MFAMFSALLLIAKIYYFKSKFLDLQFDLPKEFIFLFVATTFNHFYFQLQYLLRSLYLKLKCLVMLSIREVYLKFSVMGNISKFEFFVSTRKRAKYTTRDST